MFYKKLLLLLTLNIILPMYPSEKKRKTVQRSKIGTTPIKNAQSKPRNVYRKFCWHCVDLLFEDAYQKDLEQLEHLEQLESNLDAVTFKSEVDRKKHHESMEAKGFNHTNHKKLKDFPLFFCNRRCQVNTKNLRGYFLDKHFTYHLRKTFNDLLKKKELRLKQNNLLNQDSLILNENSETMQEIENLSPEKIPASDYVVSSDTIIGNSRKEWSKNALLACTHNEEYIKTLLEEEPLYNPSSIDLIKT